MNTKPLQQRGADRRRFHYIYKTTCLATGRYYIGMHSTDDMTDGYIGSGQRLWHSIRKHGKAAHKVEVVEHLSTRDALVLREAQLVNHELLKDPLCMNLVLGGKGDWGWGATSTEERKAARLQKMKDAWLKPGFKEAFKVKTTGRKRTEEAKAKMQAKWTPERRAAQAARLVERNKARFDDYWLTHKTRAEKRADARALHSQVNRSELSKAMWANMSDAQRSAASQAMSRAKLGRVTVNDGVKARIVPQAEADTLLANGWALGKPLAPGRARVNGRTRSA